jgi:hypothetical protein
MSSNINFRVFRRNSKNTIFLWSANALADESRLSVAAFLIDGESDRALVFSKFTPENPEKFSGDVDGIVIPHMLNKIDPSKTCTIKVLFGEGDDSFGVEKTVLPANSSPEAQERETAGPKIVHMYGMDYSTNKWVPFPVNPELLGG